MKKNQLEEYVQLEGQLQKLSSSFLLGYQTKFWKVLDDGTKIGYRNIKETQFKPNCLFEIKDVTVGEGQEMGVFQLMTPNRKFILKANNENNKKQWMRAITQLRKVVLKKGKITSKKKPQSSPTETTIASKSEKKRTTSIQKMKMAENRGTIMIEEVKSALGENKKIIQFLLKHMSEETIKYNTLLIQLKIKQEGFIKSNFIQDTFMLISPKSLYPDIRINKKNLFNKHLPPQAEINTFYKLAMNGDKPILKQIFSVKNILDINRGEKDCSVRINTGQVIFPFYCQTIEERERFINCLEIGKINAKQVIVKGKMSKINYDNLVNLHQTQNENFSKQAQKMLEQFIPNQSTHKFQPDVLVKFLTQVVHFLAEFISILEHKKQNKNHVILDVLQLFHEEVKIQIKLTWDSSWPHMKGIDILAILQGLSSYYQTIKQFITSVQFLEGMKELSKIYVRAAWKNFQSIIISIVEQQKQLNVLEDDDSDFAETNGIIDLFKFIYEVFDLAAPHWNNKIHLHNVHRLMLRALTVYINQIKSMVDEEVIPDRQMAGLANDYFRFSELVTQFYKEKFFSLSEKTKEAYEHCTKNYRQISIIILDKFSTMMILDLKIFINQRKVTFNSLKVEEVLNLIVDKTADIEEYLHLAFKRKLYQKIANDLKMLLLEMLAKEIETSKKSSKVTRKNLTELIKNIVDGFKNFHKSHYKLEKQLNELEHLLSTKNTVEIQNIIRANAKPIRELYFRILFLRQDYKKSSTIFKVVKELQNESEEVVHGRKSKMRVSVDIKEKDVSLSKKYFKEEVEKTNSDKSFKTKKDTHEKLINQGYMMKGKINRKVWEQEYFRLRTGSLYVFQYESSERCRNVIDLKNCQQILVKQEKPSFIIKYMNLGKLKEIKMKCEDMETRDRWVASIEAERKRILNQEKVKRKAVILKEGGRKKNQLIIDHDELNNGKDYFSYS